MPLSGSLWSDTAVVCDHAVMLLSCTRLFVLMCAVYSKLMVVLKTYIESADPVRVDSLCRTMKSLEYIFKFIIRSRFLFATYVLVQTSLTVVISSKSNLAMAIPKVSPSGECQLVRTAVFVGFQSARPHGYGDIDPNPKPNPIHAPAIPNPIPNTNPNRNLNLNDF